MSLNMKKEIRREIGTIKNRERELSRQDKNECKECDKQVNSLKRSLVKSRSGRMKEIIRLRNRRLILEGRLS